MDCATEFHVTRCGGYIKWVSQGRDVSVKRNEQMQSIGEIDPVGRVFANDPGDPGSIPGHVIPKTFKMVLDTSLLNTQ